MLTKAPRMLSAIRRPASRVAVRGMSTQRATHDEDLVARRAAVELEVMKLFEPPAVGGAVGQEADLQESLRQAESEFLNAKLVTSEHVSLDTIRDRFTRSSVPAEMGDITEYMAGLVQNTVTDSVHCNAPSMIGHMCMALPYYTRPLSKLVTAMHQNNVKVETAKTTTFMEREVLAMLHRQFYPQHDDAFYAEHGQSPSSSLGLVCSGGTIANISAMWIARNALLRPTETFKGVEAEGMLKGMKEYGFEDAVFIGSKVMHYSLKKAADVLGFGTQGVRFVDFDDQHRVRIDLMEQEILKCIESKTAIVSLVGVAGATETGSIDDLDAIADLAKKYGIHFHVDAAWGGPAIFSGTHSPKLAGIERADSVTLDGHKQLYTPMGCGVCMIKDPTLIQYVEKSANYIIRKESYDTGKFTLEGSRPAMGVYMHANLDLLGVEGYEALIDRSCRLTRYMADRVIAMPEAELVADPQMNIMLYRFLPQSVETSDPAAMTEEQHVMIDEFNREIQDEQKSSGGTFVSRTTIWSPVYKRDVVALRVVIANPLTTEADIDLNLNQQLEIFVNGPQ